MTVTSVVKMKKMKTEPVTETILDQTLQLADMRDTRAELRKRRTAMVEGMKGLKFHVAGAVGGKVLKEKKS